MECTYKDDKKHGLNKWWKHGMRPGSFNAVKWAKKLNILDYLLQKLLEDGNIAGLDVLIDCFDDADVLQLSKDNDFIKAYANLRQSKYDLTDHVIHLKHKLILLF